MASARKKPKGRVCRSSRGRRKAEPRFASVVDSGKRTSYDTGSVRDVRAGKGRFDLSSPIVDRRLAVHRENGSRKYGPWNWAKGQKLSDFLDSARRHLADYVEDRLMGRTPKEDHLAAAVWNVEGIIHTEEMVRRGALPPELDDLPGGPGCDLKPASRRSSRR